MSDRTDSAAVPTGTAAPDGREPTELTAALVQDLERGDWVPELLERSLARRLLLACAGDGLLTPSRIRATLWEGSVALTHVGGGRFAGLLAHLLTGIESGTPESDAALPAVLELLRRIADEEAVLAQPGGGRGASPAVPGP